MATLEIAASVIAIIQAADRVASLARYYIGALDNAPADLRAILVETATLKSVLESLKFILDANPLFPVHTIASSQGPISACEDALRELEALLPPKSSNSGPSGAQMQKRQKFELAARLWRGR
jgi:hypothetical protein